MAHANKRKNSRSSQNHKAVKPRKRKIVKKNSKPTKETKDN